MRSSRPLRATIARYARALHSKGWVANHDGNLTAKLSEDCFLATPTATSKEDVVEANLLEVNNRGEKVAGSSRRFSEINLHLAVYRERSDVAAVIHAHPPNATAIACSGSGIIEKPFLPEAIVSIGPSIPTIPFSPPGTRAADVLIPHVGAVDAVLLANHGVLAWGANLEQAYLRMELVEHLAAIALAAQAVGGVRPLPGDAIPPLLAARAKAGLGQAADRAESRSEKKTVIACAPAPHSSVEVIAPRAKASAIPAVSSEVSRIIREEILRALNSD